MSGEVEVPGLGVVALTDESVVRLEAATRAYRRARRPPRDYVAEVEEYLRTYGPTPKGQIVVGVGGRREDVLRAIEESPRVVRAPEREKHGDKATWWKWSERTAHRFPGAGNTWSERTSGGESQ